MPTDYACQAAADLAARSLNPLRDHLDAGGPGDGRGRYSGSPTDGAAGLLTFLDGLYAELSGTLTGWHSTVGNRVCGALGLPLPGAEGVAPARQPSGWEALSLVQSRSEEILTALANRPRSGPVGAAGLTRRLELVEDAFAGALRRLGVAVEDAVYCAADLAAAAGSLFGLRPAQYRAPQP
ncbi:hypothetical protein GUY61_25620, partial [Streptomyces sp. GC420]